MKKRQKFVLECIGLLGSNMTLFYFYNKSCGIAAVVVMFVCSDQKCLRPWMNPTVSEAMLAIC